MRAPSRGARFHQRDEGPAFFCILCVLCGLSLTPMRILTLLLLAASLVPAQQSAQQPIPAPEKAAPVALPSDVDSIDHIIAATYDVISGPAAAPRDWNRFLSLFYPDARLIGSGRRDGKIGARARTPEGYIGTAGEFFKKQGFFETGIHNDVQQFDHMAQVWSTYESRHSKDDAKPFTRGINSFQLLYDGSRWWVINIYWQDENPDHPIPGKYLPQ